MRLRRIAADVCLNTDTVIGVHIDYENKTVVVTCLHDSKYEFAPDDLRTTDNESELTLDGTLQRIVERLG